MNKIKLLLEERTFVLCTDGSEKSRVAFDVTGRLSSAFWESSSLKVTCSKSFLSQTVGKPIWAQNSSPSRLSIPIRSC
jgi:hypothetical protein